jgi:hypothetical protein
MMAMTNIYYSFTGNVGDEEITQAPLGLSIESIKEPGIEKSNFEL